MNLDPSVRSSATPAEPPPELLPPRRHRARSPPSPPPGQPSQRALASAWQGAFLVMRFLTWVLAGRESSPVAGWTGELWSLSPLTAKEADTDAAELAPMLGELPAGVLRALSLIGAPVLMARRVVEHLQRRERPAKSTPPVGPGTGPGAAEAATLRGH